jgi:uncharacterized membrane protein
VGLLGVCILKLFLYDLRFLDTLPRILSFIVLGLILVNGATRAAAPQRDRSAWRAAPGCNRPTERSPPAPA